MSLAHEHADNFAGAAAAGAISQWVWVGNEPCNAYLSTAPGPAAFNGTVVMEFSFNQRDVHGANAAMTANSRTANYQANNCCPWVRLNMTARVSGSILNAWITARSGTFK